jgi:hypothetical protein
MERRGRRIGDVNAAIYARQDERVSQLARAVAEETAVPGMWGR